MTTQTLTRRFRYGAQTLPDPGPHMTPEDVRSLYAASRFPELATAEIGEPEVNGATITYTFERTAGTKGGA